MLSFSAGRYNTASLVLVGSVGLLAVGLWGCISDRCDPDQTYQAGRCFLSASDLGPREASGQDAELKALGKPCADNDGCEAPVSFCVILPGKPLGYCTIENCQVAVDDCPAGYTCRDPSSFSPGQLPLCLLTCDVDEPDCPESHVCSDLSLILGGAPPLCFPE